MTETLREISDIPLLHEFDDPEWGTDLASTAKDLFSRDYQGLLRLSDGSVFVYRNSQLADLSRHPAVGHQPIGVMTSGLRHPDSLSESGVARLLHASIFSWMPPQHRPAKQLLNKVLSPKNVGKFREEISAFLNELIDKNLEEGIFDFRKDFARMAMVHFWATSIGVPLDVGEQLFAEAEKVQTSFLIAPTMEQTVVANKSAHVFMDLLEEAIPRAVIEERAPMLEDIQESNRYLDRGDQEMDTYKAFAGALIDGYHTSSPFITNMVYSMVEAGLQPTIPDRSPMEFATAVYQESSRLHPVVASMPRYSSEEFVYDGVRIPAGVDIHMGWFFGSRDPEVFADPHEYQLDRSNRVKQFTYGGGHYVCPGRNVVQIMSEMTVLELTKRSIEFEVAEEPKWAAGSMFHELHSYKVKMARS
ncbi:cytochrome P450 [Zafaria sp. Z1313]|uniref:cytochrome P450 n=1 Tax=Zafaria sp. Z1313 TaxID=3423202 RepID=UPI003D302BE3